MHQTVKKRCLQRIAELNKGPLPDRTLAAIWRELMSGSFFLERPLRISYLGPEGSFSHTAAIRKFGQSVEYEAVLDIRGIFDEVSKGHCDLGVVPIENSAGGGVIETLDAFVDTDVFVCAEVYMPIHHYLLANCAAGRRLKKFIPSRKFSLNADDGSVRPSRRQTR